jgi:hypothetical protein
MKSNKSLFFLLFSAGMLSTINTSAHATEQPVEKVAPDSRNSPSGASMSLSTQIPKVVGFGQHPPDTRAMENICYDEEPPLVSWSGDNQAGKKRWVKGGVDKIMVSVSANDLDSGLKSGKLRYYPYNAGKQEWREVALSPADPQPNEKPDNELWQAEIDIDEDNIAYEVQVQMTDLNGNSTEWTENEQATFVGVDTAPPYSHWAGDFAAGQVRVLDDPNVVFLINADDNGAGIEKVVLQYGITPSKSTKWPALPQEWKFVEMQPTGETEWGYYRYATPVVPLDRGHEYTMRVQLTDKLGNVSDWGHEAFVRIEAAKG